jgi:hypothetical protein
LNRMQEAYRDIKSPSAQSAGCEILNDRRQPRTAFRREDDEDS